MGGRIDCRGLGGGGEIAYIISVENLKVWSAAESYNIE